MQSVWGCALQRGLAHRADSPDDGKAPKIIKYFLATDSEAIRQAAVHLFRNEELITTEGIPQHTGNADAQQRLKLAADWELLSRVHELVAVGEIQSTFSASAWHYSLRAQMMSHVTNSGACMRGASGNWVGTMYYSNHTRSMQCIRTHWLIDSYSVRCSVLIFSFRFCCSAALLLCCSAALLLCCSAALLLCCSAALLLCLVFVCFRSSAQSYWLIGNDEIPLRRSVPRPATGTRGEWELRPPTLICAA
jgi:hypothetical protein